MFWRLCSTWEASFLCLLLHWAGLEALFRLPGPAVRPLLEACKLCLGVSCCTWAASHCLCFSSCYYYVPACIHFHFILEEHFWSAALSFHFLFSLSSLEGLGLFSFCSLWSLTCLGAGGGTTCWRPGLLSFLPACSAMGTMGLLLHLGADRLFCCRSVHCLHFWSSLFCSAAGGGHHSRLEVLGGCAVGADMVDLRWAC